MTSGHEDKTGPYSLWDARFRGRLAPEADALNRSLPVDRRLWREELEVAAAWLEGLRSLGQLPDNEAEILHDGLERVDERLAAGEAEGAPDEDIHTLVERLLFEEVGELAGKLRTGRSRNDQAVTATRLWVVRAAERLAGRVAELQAGLVTQAEATIDVLAPSYTHLQRAQPIRLAHFFLSHFWALERDRQRWSAVGRRAASLALGSGAVAGSGFPVDRALLAKQLGFENVARNSMDAVADRDFVAEFAFAGALLGTHLSRLGEDLILFSSSEFRFIRFDDAYSTGSSLLPQKRNPDVAELARGQGARLMGEVTAALALLKGLPSGYNKDLQEDKAILFRVLDTLDLLLPALAGAVKALRVDAQAAMSALEPSMLAVDVVDQLVRAGITFREAHAAVGALVREAEKAGATILDIERERAAELHPELPGALDTVSAGGEAEAYERSVESRSVSGGSARMSLLEQLAMARAALAD